MTDRLMLSTCFKRAQLWLVDQLMMWCFRGAHLWLINWLCHVSEEHIYDWSTDYVLFQRSTAMTVWSTDDFVLQRSTSMTDQLIMSCFRRAQLWLADQLMMLHFRGVHLWLINWWCGVSEEHSYDNLPTHPHSPPPSPGMNKGWIDWLADWSTDDMVFQRSTAMTTCPAPHLQGSRTAPLLGMLCPCPWTRRRGSVRSGSGRRSWKRSVLGGWTEWGLTSAGIGSGWMDRD